MRNLQMNTMGFYPGEIELFCYFCLDVESVPSWVEKYVEHQGFEGDTMGIWMDLLNLLAHR